MKRQEPNEVIAFDLGKTIFCNFFNQGGECVKLPFRGAYRVIRRLVQERFNERSHIISKVTPEQKMRALSIMKEDGFHEITGLPRENVEFCAERWDKAPIAKRLDVTHMVDDRPEVMAHMEFVPHRFLFQPVQEDIKPFRDKLKNVVIVQSWRELELLLM